MQFCRLKKKECTSSHLFKNNTLTLKIHEIAVFLTFCRGMPLDPSRLAQPFRPCIMPPIVLYCRLLKSSTENPEVLGFNLSKITKMSSDATPQTTFLWRVWISVEPYMYIFYDTTLQRLMYSTGRITSNRSCVL